MKRFWMLVICMSMVLLATGCNQQPSQAPGLNPFFDGQAFATKDAVRISGQPISEIEILDLISRYESPWLSYLKKDPPYRESKVIRVAKHGYSQLTYENHEIKRDLVNLPIYADDKLIAIATVFRDNNGQILASLTGPGSFGPFNAALAAYPGEKLVCVFAGRFTECLITPDNEIVIWNGNPPTVKRPANWRQLFMTEYNVMSVDFKKEDDFVVLKERQESSAVTTQAPDKTTASVPSSPIATAPSATTRREPTSTTSLTPTLKPVIYLYPQRETQVQVKLAYKGRLTCTYPAYPSDGWKVMAYPDGRLVNQENSREYSYLYWEGVTDTAYDFSRGFVVAGQDTAAFLQEKLAFLGLTPREYNEFIVFWLPHMQENPYNLISFQDTAYTDSARLMIEPQPDSLLRVFMAYKPLTAWMEIEPQVLSSFERRGFTVVEWGGTYVD